MVIEMQSVGSSDFDEETTKKKKMTLRKKIKKDRHSGTGFLPMVESP